MKYIIIILLAFFHLSFMVVNSIDRTILSYFDFYQVDKSANKINKDLNSFCTVTSKFIYLTPCMYYARYTGADCGYGFFAPNVLSSGAMSFVYKNKNIIPKFSTYEGKVRFSSLISNFISHTVNKSSINTDTAEIKHKNQVYKNIDDLNDKYYDLVMKNIAAKVIVDNFCTDTITIKLFMYEFPNLKKYGPHDTKGSYIPLKQNRFSI
ncbi:MAG: hypothetical protein H0X33_08875 [Taibaiella sp.]|nr:hypothetical protein [Taibaiella sp.]